MAPRNVRFWCRLFDGAGKRLAQWEEPAGPANSAIVLDSARIRARFNLPEFVGQLFIHATGIAGHDVVKYALDTYGDGGGALSCTHDANSWPADFYAGLPAPAEGEEVVLWLQNSQPFEIPAGEIELNVMGGADAVPLQEAVAPFATRRLSVSELLPDARWPQQVEIAAGKYVVRPRYEVFAKDGPPADRPCECRADRSCARSEARRARGRDGQGAHPARAGAAACAGSIPLSCPRRWRAASRTSR